MNLLASRSVLLMESDPAVATSLRAALMLGNDPPIDVEWVRTLPDGLARLTASRVDVALVNLAVSGHHGLAAMSGVRQEAPAVPILILASGDAEPVARAAAGEGGHDYVVTDRLDPAAFNRTVRQLIERRRLAEMLWAERQRLEVALEAIADAVLFTNRGGIVTSLNPAAEALTGRSQSAATGRPLEEVLGDASALDHSTSPIRDPNGNETGSVIVFHDSAAGRDPSQPGSHRAQYDFLTRLPNRFLLKDRLTQAIASARRRSRPLAVMFLDVDGFKGVNDTLGHAAGDQLIQSIAARLTSCMRESDTVCRFGGDEFVIVSVDIKHADDANVVAGKILSAIAVPFRVGLQPVSVTGSVGICIYPEDGEDAETLIRNADLAMYAAKQTGAAHYRRFDPGMNDHAVTRKSTEDALRVALEQREFELHYQPQINLTTGAIIGGEALIRWRHPQLGFVPASEFVSIAEESGLVVPIGQWVLREACRQARAWQDAGLRKIRVAVNVSGVEFRQRSFLYGVQAILSDTGLDARYLELELTEGALMADADSSMAALELLKRIGVRVAIDDFGTGQSSLSYLQRFPVDVLKLDQSFVHEITSGHTDAPIITAIINLGKGLSHQVIAEGVETLEQLAFLRSEQCLEGQGYLFSPAVSADQFTQMLRAGMPAARLH